MRRLRKLVWRTIERATGARLVKALPDGYDLFADLSRRLPLLKVRTAFDVGANVGQSARLYLARWPHCTVHSFEPVRSTFEELSRALAGETRAKAYPIALAAGEGMGRIKLEGISTMSSLMPAGGPAEQESDGVEAVPLDTLDRVCAREGIAAINFIKIDTEGADLDVLRGAEAMLARAAIDVVQVEAGMNPDNDRHVPFTAFVDWLAARDYLLFGIYDQWPQRMVKMPHLRRANPVFISRKLARMHEGILPPMSGSWSVTAQR